MSVNGLAADANNSGQRQFGFIDSIDAILLSRVGSFDRGTVLLAYAPASAHATAHTPLR